MKRLPILMVDFRKHDQARIRELLRSVGHDCTDEQAEQLRAIMGILPEDDNEAFGNLCNYVALDLEKSDRSLTERLAELKAEYDAAGPQVRQIVERKMLIATNTQPEHPKDWDYPCLCDECRSCG
jgi:hypothetical protein